MATRRGPRVILDPEGDTPPTDREGRSPSAKRARGDSDDRRHTRGKRRRVEERGEEGAAGTPRPTSPNPEPTPTDWGSESPLPRHFARDVARGRQGTVRGWRAEEVVELVRYVRWAGRTRGGRRHGTHLFRDLVHKVHTIVPDQVPRCHKSSRCEGTGMRAGARVR